jgi:4-amino-4-deoxy-L-arabinose transferase-like glycosyltransferase
MKKTICRTSIALIIGFLLSIEIANYILPLFWDRTLAAKLEFLVAASILLGLFAYWVIYKIIGPVFAGLTRNQRILSIILLILIDLALVYFIPLPGMAKIHNTFEMQVLANQSNSPMDPVSIQIFGVDGKKVPYQALVLSSGWEMQESTLVFNNSQAASLKYEYIGSPGQSIRVIFSMTDQSRKMLFQTNAIKVPVSFPKNLTSTPLKISKSFGVRANPAIGEHLQWMVLSSLINFLSVGFLIFAAIMGLILFIPNREIYLKKYPWINLAPIAVLAILFFWPGVFPDSSDMAYYLSLAKNLFYGRGYVHPDLLPDLYRGPIFSLLISFSYLVIGETFRSALILERIFWVLTILATYLFTRRIFNPRVGLIAALLVLTTGEINNTFSRVWTDGIMVFVILVLQLIMWEVFTNQRGVKWYILMGLLMGTAYLVKQTSIFITPLPLLMWAIFASYRTRPVLIKLLVCYAIFACFIFGWMGYVYLAGGSPGQIAGDFQKGLAVLSYFNVPSATKAAGAVPPGTLQNIQSHIISFLKLIRTFYLTDIANYFAIALVFPIALLYTAYQAILKRAKSDIFLGIGFLLFIPLLPIQVTASLGFRQNLYLYIIVLILIAAMLERLVNLLPLSKTYKDLVVFAAVLCMIYMQVSGGINITFFTDPKINPQTLDYFNGNDTTAAWINANVKPDEIIMTRLRDANIFHILTNGNRTFADINTCIGESSLVPAASCTAPYIIFWINQGTTDPDAPRDSFLGISEPAFISTIREKNVKYVIVTPKLYYLYYYLKVHPDFEEVAQLNYNVIFRVIHPVQPISSYPDVKWETCVGEGTPEYLWNLYQIYPARYQTMLSNKFGPWMGLSKQDVADIVSWKGCEFNSVYPGTYDLPQ